MRSSRPDEHWHIDTTVIRLLDGTRTYAHAAIDNYSRLILARRVANRSTAANSVAVLRAATGEATSTESTPDVLADEGVENVNAQVDALEQAGIVRRLLVLTECAHSNSLIEARWRSLKHQHAAFRGLTPDEMDFGDRRGVGARLTGPPVGRRSWLRLAGVTYSRHDLA